MHWVFTVDLTARPYGQVSAQEISYGAASEDLPCLALNETHLARWRGNCLILFGDPQTAGDLTAALAAMDGAAPNPIQTRQAPPRPPDPYRTPKTQAGPRQPGSATACPAQVIFSGNNRELRRLRFGEMLSGR
jgi:hypothetical protein